MGLFSLNTKAAFSFDGATGNFFSANPAFNLPTNTSMTVSFWCRELNPSIGLSTTGPVLKGNPGGGPSADRFFDFRIDGNTSNRFEFLYLAVPAAFAFFSGPPNFLDIVTNRMVHVLFTYTYGVGSSANMYLDGSLAGFSWVSGTGNSPVKTNNFGLTVGGNTVPWKGTVQDFCLWKKILTYQQIQNVYRSRCKLVPMQIEIQDLVAYYPCNDGSEGQSIPSRTNWVKDFGPNRIGALPNATTIVKAESKDSFNPNE